MDDNTLLIAGYSEASNGKIYSIGVTRGKCDHIVGFDGQATIVAETPYVDANLVYVKSGLLFYTEWPVNRISQLLPGDMAPAYTTDLAGLGSPRAPAASASSRRASPTRAACRRSRGPAASGTTSTARPTASSSP
ncbi:MAG: hypothetical protein H6710_08980 [Myxococcales bacterium]|nr:hypothetical protein [Myxococcales bacterium]